MAIKKKRPSVSEQLKASREKNNGLKDELESYRGAEKRRLECIRVLKEELRLSKDGHSQEAATDQEFIVWAKSQKIQVFKRGELEVHFHPLAFVDDVGGDSEPEIPDHEIDPSTDVNDVDDDLLYHSSN